MTRLTNIVIVALLWYVQSFAQVRFNEIQSSNASTITDPDFSEYVDWIELYNIGSEDFDLGGYYITDNKDNPRKWEVPPGTIIPANGYLLLWCDNLAIGLHTNFRLSVEGKEKLRLYSPSMLLTDTVKLPYIETNYSYGRTTDGTGTWGLLTQPTPGDQNSSSVVQGVAPPPTFSVPAGFYSSEKSVELHTTLAGAIIRYTTDGSDPTESSPVFSSNILAKMHTATTQKYGNNRENNTGIQQYSWPSNLSYPYGYYEGDRDYGFVIKAKVFHNDYLPSKTVASTYFINIRKPDLPVVSLTTDFDNLFNADTGIYIQGVNGISNGYVTANWNQNWERKAYIEYFDQNGQRQVGVNAGISCMGAVSRGFDLKSLVIDVKRKYGDTKINYPLFGSDGLDKYGSFILRNSGNDWELGNQVRDGIIQSIVRGQCNLQTQAFQPVVLYINGEYWGLINMRERVDDETFAAYYDHVDADDIDLMKISSDDYDFFAVKGDRLHYDKMVDFLENYDLSNDEYYNYVCRTYIDADNLINYNIANIYAQNTDWPQNNVRIWRSRDEGGVFHFPLYDTDFGYGLWGGGAYSNNLSRALADNWATLFFTSMMENDGFKNEFIQRFAYMINTTYSVGRLNTIANAIEDMVSNERDNFSDDEWTRDVQPGRGTSSMISWGTDRIGYMKDQIDSEFGYEGYSNLTVEYNDTEGTVYLCALEVTPGYSGDQYNNTPIRLKVVPADGFTFIRWEDGSGTELSTDMEYYLTIDADETVRAIFGEREQISGVFINEVMASNTFTLCDEMGKFGDWIELYNAGTSSVNVSGLYVSDNSLILDKHKISYDAPDSTTIEPGGYSLFWLDDKEYISPKHLGFNLDKDGDTVFISQKDQWGNFTIIDFLVYGKQNPDVSFGRYPDGNANTVVFPSPTPRATNTVQSTTFIDGLIITEFMARNKSTIVEETGTSADWIEIYNSNSTAIDLAGLFITDNLSDLNKYMFPKGMSSKTTIGAGEYKILWADNQPKISPLHLNFSIKAEQGDLAIVQLRGSENYIIDQISYTNQGEDISFGRFPDPTSAFRYLTEATPGSENTNNAQIAIVEGLTINEVLAANTSTVQDETGGFADYIEFYNASANPVNLGGLFVSDTIGYSLKYKIPETDAAATTINPGEWLTFWADGKPSQGILHFDFDLRALGEDVVISQVTENGLVQIDAITYNNLSPNVSYGRFPETNDNWQEMTPTYNAMNQSVDASTDLASMTSSFGFIVPEYSSNIDNYVCEVESGTTTPPTISVVTVNENASVTITQANTLSEKALVEVISADGNFTNTITIAFVIAPSRDATLQSLEVASGTLTPAFDPTVMNYTVSVASVKIPLLTAIANSENALVDINYANTFSGQTTITVTAESGDVGIYTIDYTAEGIVINSWEDNCDDNDMDGWFSDELEYTLSEVNQELYVDFFREGTDDVYNDFLYLIPEQFRLDISANPIVQVDVKTPLGTNCNIRIDLYDVNGRQTNERDIVYESIGGEGYQTFLYDYTGRLNDAYGSITGPVDATHIIGISVILEPGETWEDEDKDIYIDNLRIGDVQILSSNSDLASLTSSLGNLSPTFSTSVYEYTLTLPAGTTTIPVISATADDANAIVEISQASALDGSATVRVIAENQSDVSEYTIDFVRSPVVVEGYADELLRPSMAGFNENNATYSLQYAGGEIDVLYNRSVTSGNDYFEYNVTEADALIVDMTNNPYVSIFASTTVETDIRVDLVDGNGNVQNVAPITNTLVTSEFTELIYNFIDNTSQVDISDIRALRIYFDAGSVTPVSGTITFDKILLGDQVSLAMNESPIVNTIPDQTRMQTKLFNTILLNNYVTDDETADADLIWSVSSAANFDITISTDHVVSIVPKSTDWVGSETITFTVKDEIGKSTSVDVVFTVTELIIDISAISFIQSETTIAYQSQADISSLLEITPANANVASVVWSTPSTNALVQQDGIVTNNLAFGIETAVLTATVTDNSGNVYSETINIILEGCPVEVESVVLSADTSIVVEGSTLQLLAAVEPANACIKTATYSSSDNSIATVNASGLANALIPGTVTITYTVNDGFTTTSGLKILTILKDCSGDIELQLSDSNLDLVEGNFTELSAQILPNNECTLDNVVTWRSTDEAIATVTDGIVVGVTPGIVSIIAETTGNGKVADTCEINVLRDCTSGQLTLSISSTSETITIDDVLQLAATVETPKPCNAGLVWTSSDESVATVVDGKVTALSFGTTTITASSVQTPVSTVECIITVAPIEVSSISIDEILTMSVADIDTLNVLIEPADAYDKSVTWECKDPIAVIDDKGIINAISSGMALVIATSSNGLKDTCLLEIHNVIASNITLNISSVTLQEGETQQLIANILPANTTDKSIIWTSNNTSVATVNASGLVEAVTAGIATISAETSNGLIANIEITVEIITIPVSSVELIPETSTISTTDTLLIEGIVLPTDATNKTLVWSSSDESVAIVNQSGQVFPVSVGDVMIIARASNGIADTTYITVGYTEVSSVSFTNETITLDQTQNFELSSVLQIKPVAAEIESVVWNSDSQNLPVSTSGTIENQLLYGSEIVTVTVTVTDKSGNVFTDDIIVYISGCDILIESYTIAPDTIVLNAGAGATYNIVSEMLPANACIESQIYSVGNSNIATVNANGIISALSAGSTYVYSEISDGYTLHQDSLFLNVVEEILPTSISLTAAININVGDSASISAVVLPANASNKTVEWRSLNTYIARVNKGTVTGLIEGVVPIVGSTVNGFTDTSIVTVRNVAVTGVLLTYTKLTLSVYETATLSAIIQPQNATIKDIVWTSSNKQVATVDANGEILAKQAGNTVVYATANNGVAAACVVTVNDILPSQIQMSVANDTMNVLDQQQIEISFTPDNATNKELTYSSDNTTIATVNSNGLIVANAPGKVTIKATTVNGIKDSVTIVVNPVPVTGLTVTPVDLTIQISESQQLFAEVFPVNATDKSIVWSSSADTIASVNTNGKITGIGVGTATITATSVNGFTSDIQVTVKRNTVTVTGVDIVPDKYTLYVGEKLNLELVITPENATNKNCVWSSDKISVATVNQTGEVQAMSVGTAIITAESSNGIIGTSTITVVPVYAQSVSITLDSLVLTTGATQQMLATVSPQNTTNKSLIWSVANTDIAEISSNGMLTALALGETYVLVKTINGWTDTCIVEVKNEIVAATDISIVFTVANIYVGQVVKATVSFEPANVSNKSITWKSLDESVCISSAAGEIYAVSEGIARIVAIASNGVSDTLVLNVEPAFADTIIISPRVCKISVYESYQLYTTIYPAYAIGDPLQWSSGDESIVTVNQSGLLTGVSAGSALITVTTVNGKSSVATVNVDPIFPVNFSLNYNEVEIMETESLQLEADFVPVNTTATALEWQTSDTSVFTVNNKGVLLAKNQGTAILTVTTENDLVKSITVTVSIYNEAPVVTQAPSQTIKPGESFSNFNLNSYFSDENTTSAEMIYTANAEGKVLVNINSNGNVTVFVRDYNWEGSETVTFYATDKYGARSSMEIVFTISSVVSVAEYNKNEMRIYPNACKDFFTLEFTVEGSQQCAISFYDITGKMLYTENATIAGKYAKTYDVSKYKNGSYDVVIVTEDAITKQSLIIVK